nr:failed axon connections homolog [Procambarus clarkii]XP_045603776.1 failed axon connections homolog [Procambarus clarkii]XP_045603777.1 failed axon connections homolog [Procambarus clarkii]
MAWGSLTGRTSMKIAGKGLKILWNRCRPCVVAAIVVVGAIKITTYIKRQNRRKLWNNVGKDVVVLHMFDRGRYCPNLSPFVVKLETYLRMAEIPYQVDYEEPFGPKGKSPWITLNGEEIGDSQLIMEKLGPLYNKDFSSTLTQEQKAVAHFMRLMIEDHFLWCFVVWRYTVDGGRTFVNGMELPIFMRLFVPSLVKRVKHMTKMQGIGLHSHTEVEEMGRKDIAALSVYLGDKQYLMGEEPAEVDCSVFGMLSQIVWNSPNSPYLRMLDNEFTNLHAYCQRMKARFWADWNECLKPPLPVSQ